MEHPNILEYIGSEKRDNLSAEFWLITAYHERGSLCDFLKAHIITWSELCRIAESMTSGNLVHDFNFLQINIFVFISRSNASARRHSQQITRSGG